MSQFTITPLGTGAALPAQGRHPSAHLLNADGHLYLVDCGEGTQERLRWAGINFNRIERVLIGHLHGDHYLGLMGLMSTMHLLGRTDTLHVHAPAELHAILELQVRASRTYLRYRYEFHPHPETNGAPLFNDGRVKASALSLDHRVPTTGFLFEQIQRARRLRPDQLDRIPHYMRRRVVDGEDLPLPDGGTVPNTELTYPGEAPKRFAYCTDTAPAPDILPHIQGVDLLYHDCTFGEALAARAKDTKHSTATEAATIARDAGAKALLLGHFSSRYKDLQCLLDEARSIFPAATIAEEGSTYTIG